MRALRSASKASYARTTSCTSGCRTTSTSLNPQNAIPYEP
jgi:hypothetical protein